MNSKQSTYQELLENNDPDALQDVWDRLDIYSWTEDDDVNITVGPHTFSVILKRYLSGQLSEQQVEDWANFVEAAHFISSSSIGDRAIEIIHCLANPVLEGDLTPERAQRLLDVLQSGMPSKQEIHDAYR